LITLGRKIGADVPFFLLDTPFAIARGIGDNLNIIKTNTRFWHVLIYPGFKLSTKDIYRVFDTPSFALTGAQGNVKMIFLSDSRMDYDRIKFMLYNDLERAAVSKKKVLGYILKGLAQLLDRKFIVSGSGPSLFCLYNTGKEALAAKSRVLKNMPANQRRGWQVFVVQTA
jgi:4-diphosphocytidyl-2-C-methyl-D-erythritol kinase